MKYQLAADHYANDLLIPNGSVVGVPGDEGIQFYWVESDGLTPRAPSREMIPLDQAAKDAFKKQFEKYGGAPIPKDPLIERPVLGTGSGAKAPAANVPGQIKHESPRQTPATQAAAPASVSIPPKGPAPAGAPVPPYPSAKPSVSSPGEKK